MSSFQIFKDQENDGAVARKARNEKVGAPKANVLQPPKRAVLGVVNENKQRIQHPRAVKQLPRVLKDENAQSRKNEPKPMQQKVFPVHEDLPKEKKKVASIAEQKDKICIFVDQKPSTSTSANVQAKEQEPVLKKVESVFDHVDISEKSQDAEISTNIAHLHIPDSEDSLGPAFKVDLDMSMDSLCGSPMSVDKTLSVKRNEYQVTLDHFYNVEEYEAEIYNYIKNSEVRYRPKPGYMRKQPDITYPMRSILVDWLVEVADEYNLQSETLFLAVSYIDRFLSYMSVVRGKLQLVGTAAMFIAAKFEEIYPPDVGEFVYITDDTYTRKQVLRMEHLILKVLAFDMSSPTILRFMTKYAMVTKSSKTLKHLTQFLCELTLLDAEHFLQYLPSEVAAASTALARHTMGMEAWPASLEQLTGMSLQHLTPCLTYLTAAFSTAASYPQQAVRDKYKSAKWSCVSQLTPASPSLVPMEPSKAPEVSSASTKPVCQAS